MGHKDDILYEKDAPLKLRFDNVEVRTPQNYDESLHISALLKRSSRTAAESGMDDRFEMGSKLMAWPHTAAFFEGAPQQWGSSACCTRGLI